MSTGVALRGVARSQAGAISVSALVGLGIVAALVYVTIGVVTTKPDRYGRVPVPANSYVSLPGAETDISWVAPANAVGEIDPPRDLHIVVTDPRTGQPLRVNSYGGDVRHQGGETLKPIARIDAPGKGVYQVKVTSTSARTGSPAQLAFGESPAGAVGDRLKEIGSLVVGPPGIAAAFVLLGMLLAPSLRRAINSQSPA